MEQVNDFIPAANSHGEKYGYTLWAVELKENGDLIGFIGLNYTDWESHFTPAVEVGWRLGSQYWGLQQKDQKLLLIMALLDVA